MTGSGDRGILRVGYEAAVELHQWKLEGDKKTLGPPEFTIRARVYRVNEFWVTQTPKDLGLYMGESIWWVWEKVQPPHHRDIRPGATIEFHVVDAPLVLPRF